MNGKRDSLLFILTKIIMKEINVVIEWGYFHFAKLALFHSLSIILFIDAFDLS